MTALADVGVVRRLLDQAEFEAVRTARRQGRSWSEIAIRLGVTRQSAWERWRDVDDAVAPPPTGQATHLDDADADAVRRARQLLSDSPDLPEDASVQAVRKARMQREVRELRWRSTVEVPNVIGLSWGAARTMLLGKGLVPASPDPNDPPPEALGSPDAVVTDQSPESGAMVPPGSPVRLWVDRGGGSGVREPRRPKPDPKTGRKMWDEVTDEAVG